jgi:fructokinase
MNGPWQIAGIGEILWDLFPTGPRFGGAPANFACHTAALVGTAHMVSAIGRDPLGDQALAALADRNVDTRHVVRTAGHPTGQVTVAIDGEGQPSYHFGRDEAWDHLEWSAELERFASRTDAVCFGTLGQRSRQSRGIIQRFLATTPRSALRVFDVNLRAAFYDESVIRQSLAEANVLKLNADELRVVARMFELDGSDEELLAKLADRFSLQTVALTRGSEGAILFGGGEMSRSAAGRVVVSDTVGAGDAFTAALTCGLLGGNSLASINRRACEIAAFVCSQPGGTPPIPAELRRTLAV